MKLPEAVRYCMGVLQDAGFRAYGVGGCVRDGFLGLTPQDYDLCTDALPQQIARLFEKHTLVRSGEKHGTIGVVVDGSVYEITTFRTEGGYTDSRHPDWVRFVPRLEEDLSRRDFTVNAMAYCPDEGYIDPWGGRQDLQDRVLRAVGDPKVRFTEDPLRILRGVRFAVRYALTPEKETLDAMLSLAPLMEHLARERVFDELCKLLPTVGVQDLLWAQPIITQVIPELKPAVGFLQHNPHHRYDVYTHTAHVVAGVAPRLVLRWAALLHDVGKPHTFTPDQQGVGHFPDHDRISAQTADQVLLRLKAPNALRQQVVTLIQRHMMLLPPESKVVRRWLGKLGSDLYFDLLELQRADMQGKGTDCDTSLLTRLTDLAQTLLQQQACVSLKDLAIKGDTLIALGLSGKNIGLCLNALLEQVMDETTPNTPEDLLQAAKDWKIKSEVTV